VDPFLIVYDYANPVREEKIGHWQETICTPGLLSAALSCYTELIEVLPKGKMEEGLWAGSFVLP
jgi:hypothetical protein